MIKSLTQLGILDNEEYPVWYKLIITDAIITKYMEYTIVGKIPNITAEELLELSNKRDVWRVQMDTGPVPLDFLAAIGLADLHRELRANLEAIKNAN